jgi:hypothetical protein
MVIIFTTSFNLEKHILHAERVYVYFMDLRTNIKFFSITDFCNTDGVCLLRGPDWFLKGLMMILDALL